MKKLASEGEKIKLDEVDNDKITSIAIYWAALIL